MKKKKRKKIKTKKNKDKDKKHKKKRKEGEREGDTGHHTRQKPRKSRFVSGQQKGQPKGGQKKSATGVLESCFGGTAAYQAGKSVATDSRCQTAASHASTANDVFGEEMESGNDEKEKDKDKKNKDKDKKH